MNAGAAPGKKLGDGAIGIPGLQQFNLGLAEAQGHDTGGIDRLRFSRGQSQHVSVERQSRFYAGHGQPDVSDDRGGRHDRTLYD